MAEGSCLSQDCARRPYRIGVAGRVSDRVCTDMLAVQTIRLDLK